MEIILKKKKEVNRLELCWVLFMLFIMAQSFLLIYRMGELIQTIVVQGKATILFGETTVFIILFVSQNVLGYKIRKKISAMKSEIKGV